MFTLACISLTLGYLVLVWLRTNAFVEYMTLCGLSKFFHISEYNKLHDEGYAGSYTDFLYEYYQSQFFVRLVCCPVCLSFWLGLFTGLCVATQLIAVLVAAPLILFFYLVFNRML